MADQSPIRRQWCLSQMSDSVVTRINACVILPFMWCRWMSLKYAYGPCGHVPSEAFSSAFKSLSVRTNTAHFSRCFVCRHLIPSSYPFLLILPFLTLSRHRNLGRSSSSGIISFFMAHGVLAAKMLTNAFPTPRTAERPPLPTGLFFRS